MKRMLNKINTKATTWVVGLQTKKKRGDKALIVEIGLGVVAVFLLIVYRDQMKPLLQTLLSFVTDKVKALFSTL